METKLKAPEGLTSFSYSGTEIKIPDNGIIVVSYNPAMAEVMKSHGFVEVAEELPQTKPPKSAAGSKARRSME